MRYAHLPAVEHCFHTAGVTGSIPVPPTTRRQTLSSLFTPRRKSLYGPVYGLRRTGVTARAAGAARSLLTIATRRPDVLKDLFAA